MKERLYVGLVKDSLARTVFRTATPNEEKCPRYAALIGPFRTRRAAEWMAHPIRGMNNPHCVTVRDAERLALKYKGEYNAKTRKWSDPV